MGAVVPPSNPALSACLRASGTHLAALGLSILGCENCLSLDDLV